MSIIFPSTVNTPTPFAEFSLTARTIFSAAIISFSLGAYISCTAAICRGLTSDLPSNPICLSSSTSAVSKHCTPAARAASTTSPRAVFSSTPPRTGETCIVRLKSPPDMAMPNMRSDAAAISCALSIPFGLSSAAISSVLPFSLRNSSSAASTAFSTAITSPVLSHLAMRTPSAPAATHTRTSSRQCGVSSPFMRTITSVSP